MNKPTASGLERAMRCGASLKLPVIRTTSDAADRGVWRHRFLERVGQVGAAAALAEVPAEHRDACAALPLDDLPTHLAAEVALAFDVATGKGRIVGRGLNRMYGPLGPMELAGTADAIGEADDGSLLVLDWKSAGYKGRAADSVQLRFLALAAARAYGADNVRVEIVRLGDGGEVSRSWHDYDALDLDAFAAELRDWFAKAGQDDRPVEGAHCTYCPSWQACDAKTGLLRLAASGGDIAAPFMGGLSHATVGRAYVLAENLRAMARELDKRVAAALDELGPCETGRGTIVRKALVEGNEKLDGEAVVRVLSDRYGPDVVGACTEVTATKKKLGEGLRKYLGRGGAQAERDVLDKVRQMGGASRSTSERVVEIDPAKERGVA